ncbi:MAG: hypothetical protein CTY35_00105 [Methylotenera sp.]|uniref:hypothetical protein n=1 Tax=Methylotenera sp. TaxID=2051956 RepID=UPI000D422DF7|nr:hypothetical protein [Methylotenera sp.]PPC84758.1 MAG: hypothetical protein CTY38_00105 [Methylotenera sp.]PPD02117.1 MAG: hypothetical protein CTY35_00105 [Methylotenera sp.]
MGLQQYRKPANTNGGRANSNLGGAAVKVIQKNVVDGKVTITAEVMFNSIGHQEGDQVTVHFDPQQASKIDDNLKKGMGTSQGSVLILENCTKLEGEGQIQARWVTTAISSAKSAAEDTGHGVREVEKAFLVAPTVFFENPSVGPDEPRYIHFGITSESARLRTQKGYAEFDRAWFMNKLAQVADYKTVRVQALALQPAYSVKANTIEEAFAAIQSTISSNGGAALVRVKDETDSIETVIVRTVYGKEPEVVVNDLRSAGLFRNVPNEAIAAEVESGNFTLEVIPGVEIPFLGDSLQRIVKDLSTRPVAELINFNVNYGRDKYNLATESILVTLPTKSGAPCFCHDPIRVQGESFNMRYIPSPFINVKEPAPAANGQAADASQDNAGQAAEAGGESFDANDYDFEPADSQGQTVEDQQSTASARRSPGFRD